MPTFQKYLQQLKENVQEMDVAALKKRHSKALIVDIRETSEYAQGFIPGATWVSRGMLEQSIEAVVADREAEIVLYCAGGIRSILAAHSLAQMGYEKVWSLAGGFGAWKRAGEAFEMPKLLSAEQEIRYSRHTMLPEVGKEGQLRLLGSKVLCLGAGGLGSPAALYLAAAGVGTIGIVDDDIVDASNLQRQVLHSTDRVGMPKVDSAAQTLEALNPDVRVVKHATRLCRDNAEEIVSGYDLVVDGADNFPTRYLLNDVALKLAVPVVHASIYRFEGQLTVFEAGGQPCYRCLFPEPPPPELAPSCAEAGVLGVLPGVMGVLQATEAIKLLLGFGTSLSGRLLAFDAAATVFRELKIKGQPGCAHCGDKADSSKIELIDYGQFCSGSASLP